MTTPIITKTTDDRTPVEIRRFDRVILEGLPYTYGQRTEAGMLLHRDD